MKDIKVNGEGHYGGINCLGWSGKNAIFWSKNNYMSAISVQLMKKQPTEQGFHVI